jgi:hypothetical protein
VAEDRLVVAVMSPAVAAVTPQVVAAEDIAVAAVRTEAVTNSYFSPATDAVLRDGVFISPTIMVRDVGASSTEYELKFLHGIGFGNL